MIRLANPADAPMMAEIYNQAIDDRVHANCDVPQSREKFLAAYFSGGGRYVALVHESNAGEIGGWGALKKFSARPDDDSLAEVAVYVQRGRRSAGLGIYLLRALIKHAEKVSFHSLIAIILGENVESIRGSRSCGFQERVRIPAIANMYGRYEDIVWMQKTLTGGKQS